VIKKRKIPKALRISTPNDNADASGPNEEPAKEKDIEKEPELANEEKDGDQQDHTLPEEEDAPTSQKKDDPQPSSDADGNEVCFNFTFV
jgi:hypothetical protein